jgi:hypothetical protein
MLHMLSRLYVACLLVCVCNPFGEPLVMESVQPLEAAPSVFLNRNILAVEDFGGSVIPSPYADRMAAFDTMSDEEIEGMRRSVAMLRPGAGVTREMALGLFNEVQRLRSVVRDETQPSAPPNSKYT